MPDNSKLPSPFRQTEMGITYQKERKRWYFFHDNTESWLVLLQIPNENSTE